MFICRRYLGTHYAGPWTYVYAGALSRGKIGTYMYHDQRAGNCRVNKLKVKRRGERGREIGEKFCILHYEDVGVYHACKIYTCEYRLYRYKVNKARKAWDMCPFLSFCFSTVLLPSSASYVPVNSTNLSRNTISLYSFITASSPNYPPTLISNQWPSFPLAGLAPDFTAGWRGSFLHSSATKTRTIRLGYPRMGLYQTRGEGWGWGEELWVTYYPGA